MIVGSRTVLVKLVPCCVALSRVVVMYSVAGILRMIAEVFLTLHLTASRPAHIQARAGSSGAARHDAPTRPIAPIFQFASLSPSAKENLSANHDNSEPILGAAQRQPAICSSKRCGRLSAPSRSLQRSQLAGSFTFQTANGDPDRDRRSFAIVGHLDACSTIGAKRDDCREPGRRSELSGAHRCGSRRGRGTLP